MNRIAFVAVTLALAVPTASMAQDRVSDPAVRHLSRRPIAAAAAKMATAPAVQTAAPAPRFPVTFVVGADVPLAACYIFRGIVQEFDPQFTFQPYMDVGVGITEKVTINIGTWNSFHTGSNNDALDGSWYESDFYASATFVTGRWKPGVLYTLYGSPAGGYDGVGPDGSIGVSELAAFVSYDDSASNMPVSPKVLVAFELTDTQADFGAGKGSYLELSGRPTFKTASPMTLSVPVKLGLSLKDYYEAGGEDHRFGYFQVGGSVSVPLSFMRAGAWEAHGGVDLLVFGDARRVQQANDDDPRRFKPVVNLGFSATF